MIDVLKNNFPGAIFSVCESGDKIQHYCSGVADIGKNIPLTPDHIFQIGEITRTFSAAIILRLVETGVVDLDMPLDTLSQEHHLDSGRLKLIVDLYPFLKPITVRELLNHTSGIPAYDETKSYEKMFFAKPKKVWQAEGYLDVITGEKIRYLVGYEAPVHRIFSDSATNYIMVSLVLEALTGQRVSQQMRGFFNLLDLQGAYYSSYGVLDQALLPRVAHGYLPASHPYASAFMRLPILTYNNNRELRVIDVTNAYNFNGLAGSAAMATTADLITVFKALMKGKIVTSALKEMFSVVPVNPALSIGEDQDYYGLGIYKTISKRYGEIVWNAGNNDGYGVLVGCSLDRDITFAVAVNVSRQIINVHN